MAVATHIEPVGAADDANNIIRTAGAVARFVPQTPIRPSDSFHSDIGDSK